MGKEIFGSREIIEQAGINDRREVVYNDLCRKMEVARTNNEFVKLYEGFASLGNFSDARAKSKKCLDKLTFNSPKELTFLANSYSKIDLPQCAELGKKCAEVATEWQHYEDDYERFNSVYTSRPYLLKLWDRFSTFIIIIGVVTLLWGFIVYFGAVLLEFIFRGILTAIKRDKPEYKEKFEQLSIRKQNVDAHLYTLRRR